METQKKEQLQAEINRLGYEVFKLIRHMEMLQADIQKRQQEVSKLSVDIAAKEKELQG